MKNLVILSLFTLVSISCVKTAPLPNFDCEVLLAQTEQEISKKFTKEDLDVVSAEFRILEAMCEDGTATFFIQFSLVLEIPNDLKKEGAENMKGEILLEMKSYMKDGALVLEKGNAQVLSIGVF